MPSNDDVAEADDERNDKDDASGQVPDKEVVEEDGSDAEKDSDPLVDGGLQIVRPSGEDSVADAEDVAGRDSATELQIENTEQEETVDVQHMGLDTKYDPTADLSNYKLPPVDLLKDDYEVTTQSNDELKANSDRIIEALKNFGIKIDEIKATVGPTVTLYEVVPAPGIRVSKIQILENDIAMSLKALGIRIIAPLPGRGTVGIEVPNSKPQVVSMSSVIRSKKFQESEYELPVALGKTISNETLVFDLTKTPHLLVAGATGQGKSVGLNAIITSILYKKHPSQVKFVMVDPKMVEFSIYKGLEKFFLAKMEGEDDAIITEVEKVKNTLLSLTIEMDNRYKLLEKANVRQIKEYNAKFIDRMLNPENGHRYLPYIVVIIDEFADLIMQAGKEIEMPIARIAQKARAVGIHMILATQRPSTNIITGVIKAQFPSRIAFKVASMTDSRTIIDQTGAQYLIGRGDLLFCQTGSMSPVRVQCAFVDTPEVESVTSYISSQQGYLGAYELPEYVPDGGGVMSDGGGDSQSVGKFDSMIKEVAIMVVRQQMASTSYIQRAFEVGYNRAGKMTDQLQRMGIVSEADHRKNRTVLVQTETDLDKIFERFGIQ
ncbi:MAG: DNA translocase FtsK [Marinilabiliaceae bacterium]